MKLKQARSQTRPSIVSFRWLVVRPHRRPTAIPLHSRRWLAWIPILIFGLLAAGYAPAPLQGLVTAWGEGNPPNLFANPDTIIINDNSSATPYPATITVSGLLGHVVNVTATLTNLSHSYPSDVRVLLVGPTGAKVILLAKTGDGHEINNVTLTFVDAAADELPEDDQITSGMVRPTDYDLAESLPAPAPPRPYPTNLAVFTGSNPNGTWSLYVSDNSEGDSGEITDGWQLAITVDDNSLFISPPDDMTATGPLGGPFTPATGVYVLSNAAASSVSWNLNKSEPWIDCSATGGTLAGGAATNVLITINANAETFSPGHYTATLTFSNLTSSAAEIRTVHLTVEAPVVYSFPLDTNPGWTMTGEWEFGPPKGGGGTANGHPDPTAGATGTNVFGVNLNGDYSTTAGGPYYLTTCALNFTGYSNVVLRFQRWLNTDFDPYATATIEVSTNGAVWEIVWANGTNSVTDNSWQLQSYSLSPLADQQATVYVRWGYQIGEGPLAYSGWNIDDIEFTATPLAGSCQYSLLPTGTNVSANGGPISLLVNAAPASCTWTASADAPWITNLSPTSGTGTMSVAFYVLPNAGASRTGTVTVAGLTYVVAQAAALTAFEQWQLNYFYCTNCPQAAATADPDGDGQSNEIEFLTGMNPTNAASYFHVTALVRDGPGLRVFWLTAGGRTNEVLAASAISGTCTNISPWIIIPGSGEVTTNYLDSGAVTNQPARFYRIRLVP